MHLDTNYLHQKNQQSILNSSQENHVLPKFRGHTDEWRDKVNYRVFTLHRCAYVSSECTYIQNKNAYLIVFVGIPKKTLNDYYS